MEGGISIMPRSIRPVSANCAAGIGLKETTGCKMERGTKKKKEKKVVDGRHGR